MKLFPYERYQADLLHWRDFARRVGRHLVAALCLAAFALGIGMAGYHAVCGLSWVDAFLNAAMILGGMGPVNPLTTPQSKLFAGLYALFCGLVFVGLASITLAPFLHRLLHELHLDCGVEDATGD
jgi:hypothetical protein